jgi:hypothetical protein
VLSVEVEAAEEVAGEVGGGVGWYVGDDRLWWSCR